MKRKFKFVIAAGFTIMTILLLITTVHRSMLDYNGNGVYFDAETVTTYDQDAILGYGSLTILFFVATVVSAAWVRKTSGNQP